MRLRGGREKKPILMINYIYKLGSDCYLNTVIIYFKNFESFYF